MQVRLTDYCERFLMARFLPPFESQTSAPLLAQAHSMCNGIVGCNNAPIRADNADVTHLDLSIYRKIKVRSRLKRRTIIARRA